MSRFAVLVEFRLKPGMRAEFRHLIDANAQASVTDEAGCFRFDVLEPDDKPDTILLYEIYADGAAFQLHLDSAHYKTFAAVSADLCIDRAVTRCALVLEGGA